MKFHGNQKTNRRPHHLYLIYDYRRRQIYKFGISHDPVEQDGLSKRLRSQLKLHNSTEDVLRYRGRVLIIDIEGREKAYWLEDESIDTFRLKHHGTFPNGNTDHNYKGRPSWFERDKD
ncbi:MAG: hypothetical protein AB8H12_03550 [Lewinella sp.]